MTDSALVESGRRARSAARALATTSSSSRSDALGLAADLLAEETEGLLEANRVDVEKAVAAGLDAAATDRLKLDRGRVSQMAAGLRSVAALADPVGEVVDGWVRPNGLRVERVRVPLGVVGIIYENRPNVTSDATALCVKSGNVAFLRGSSSALESNRHIVGTLRKAFARSGLPEDAAILVEDTRRETVIEFMRLRGVIDCLVPRGGKELLAALVEHATVPYVLDGDGNCHVYVDASADVDMAEAIVVNSKTQRPGVCNAAESLLVHAAVAPELLERLSRSLAGVELVGDERARALLPSAGRASDADFATEFLGLKLAVGVVDDIDGAIAHIARFGSGHSEAIVTNDVRAASRFVDEVDAAAVLVNVSTRFVDGAELGLGAEVGISTQKLHARGPMGLRELMCVKWVVRGDGQLRT